MCNNLKPNIIISAGFDTGFIGVEGVENNHTFTNTAIFFSGMTVFSCKYFQLGNLGSSF